MPNSEMYVKLNLHTIVAPEGDLLSESDIYVVLGSGRNALRTATAKDSNVTSIATPFVLPIGHFPLTVDVFDADGLRDDHMGQFRIDAPEEGEAESGALTDRSVCLKYSAERVALLDPLALLQYQQIRDTAADASKVLRDALESRDST